MEDLFEEAVKRARTYTIRTITKVPSTIGEGETLKTNPTFEILFEFIEYWLYPIKHHELLAEGAMEEVVERIYRSPHLIDYVNGLRFYVFGHMANADIITIINRLSWALVRNPTPNNQGSDFCALPKDVNYMQVGQETADVYLRHNTWLIPLMLIGLGDPADGLNELWEEA